MSDNKFEDILNKINEIKDDLKKDFGGKQFKYMRQDPSGPVAVYGSGDKQRTLAEHVAHMDLVNPKRHDMPEALPKEVEFHLKTKGKNLKFGSPDHLAILKFINETHASHPEYSHYVNNTLLNKTISVLEKLEAIEELIKSNYGPKKAGLYDPTVNQDRKAKNIDKIPELGQNQNVKTYTSAPQGTATQQADKEAKEAKKKSKKMPVKVGTPEEIASMNAKMNADAAKPITGIDDMKKGAIKNAVAAAGLGLASMAQGQAPQSPAEALHHQLSQLNVIGEYSTPHMPKGAILKENFKTDPSHAVSNYHREGLNNSVMGNFYGPDANKAHALLAGYDKQHFSKPTSSFTTATPAAPVQKTLPPGYIKLQPTDEELFGSLVVDPEQMVKAEKEWENTIQKFYDKSAVKLPPEDQETGWVSGKSFNECFLTEEEKAKRNMHTGE